MNAFLVVLLAAVASAAPGGLIAQPQAITFSAAPVAHHIQPVAHHIQPVAHHVQVAPAVAHVQVPVTKTVHYETKPVVTGYSTSIIKPAIAQIATPVLPAVQQVHVQGNFRQIPDIPAIPMIPGFPGMNGSADAPQIPSLPMFPVLPGQNGSAVGDSPQFPAFPDFPAIPGGQIQSPDNTRPAPSGQFKYDFFPQIFNDIPAPVAVAPAPITVAQPAPIAVAQPADATIIEARAAVPVAAPVAVAAPAYYPAQYSAFQAAPVAVAAPAPVLFRQAQAADFEPLVTKQQVLAPVRTHTEITPQITQIQPEVTVRKVIHDVPVQTPVAVQTPVIHQVAAPAFAFNQHVFPGQQFVF